MNAGNDRGRTDGGHSTAPDCPFLVRPLFLWGPVIGYTAFIFWISSTYRPIPGMEFFSHMDKVWHLAEYCPLGSFWMRALHRSFPARGSSWKLFYVAAFTAIFATALLDEWTQGFVPGKETDFWDASSDLIGAAFGQWLYGSRFSRPPSVGP